MKINTLFTVLSCLLGITYSTVEAKSTLTKPFIVGDIFAELGNQFFATAATLSLAWDNDAEAHFPDFDNEKRYNTHENYELIFWRLDKTKPKKKVKYYYDEPEHPYTAIPYKPNMRMHGYFQSEKYFKHHKDEILAIFEPKKEILDYIDQKYGALLNQTVTVAIHVRTYTRPVWDAPNCFPLNGREYIQQAMTFFPADATYVVCSDNIEWCKENLSDLAPNMHFIEGEKYYYDFYIMSLCTHNIISNSTFSWWSAYLNKNPNKIVIAPKKWFNESLGKDTRDLIPDEWIQI